MGKEIEATVLKFMNAMRTQDEETALEAGTGLLVNFLVNQQRMADALEQLAATTTQIWSGDTPDRVLHIHKVT